ncbi:hypothetical protein MKC90_15450 [[Clostridium] innocuum]|nr:hypothetical protein [[Clostridium] innocuum]
MEDTFQPQQDKRWVVVSPPGSNATTILLAKASNSRQEACIGDQAGARVFLFLATYYLREIIRIRSKTAFILYGNPKRWITALLLYLKICMETSGIWYSFKRDIRCVNGCNRNRQYRSCAYTRSYFFH